FAIVGLIVHIIENDRSEFPDANSKPKEIQMADRILIKDGIVLSVDKQIGNFMKADVLIEGSKIAAVGPNLKAEGAEVIDASKTIVMPGFIDTHRHVWEGILRNIGTDVPLEGEAGYLSIVLNKLAPVFRPEDAY